MKHSICSIIAVVTLGLLGAYAIGQSAAPPAPSQMGGDMKGMMMMKMPPEMMMRCQMLMNTMVSPGDPTAILALKDQLKLTDAQTTQFEAINKEASAKAMAILTADQKKTLDTMPKSPQTMKEMHEQMMGQMQMMMGGKMGDQPMSCPMMQMMQGQMGATTQPQAGSSPDQDHAAHH